MGSRESVLDDDASENMDLAYAVKFFKERWLDNPSPTKLSDLNEDVSFSPACLRSMFELYSTPDEQRFFSNTLPFIIGCAAKLPELLPELKLKKLRQNQRDSLLLPRDVVASLIAHMFLCTLVFEKRSEAMPGVLFDALHMSTGDYPQEVAKMRMFVNYFERMQAEPPQGQLRIYRQVRRVLPPEELELEWSSSTQPLLEIDMVDMHVGFENIEKGKGCLHADFANMFLGGGVLSGGCVQEEIRFAICPELCAAMIVCPCMLANEGITVVGGEQFSNYSGYARRLQYAGSCTLKAPRDADGTALVAITAMDALDLRRDNSSIAAQMEIKAELRELEKATAAFEPVDDVALKTWPIIATGNWGCGVFGGSIPVKAVLQWLAASQGRRALRYFPFDSPIGPELMQLSTTLCKAGVTVGQLFTALRALTPPQDESKLLTYLQAKALAVSRKAGPPNSRSNSAKGSQSSRPKDVPKRKAVRSPGKRAASPGTRQQ